MASLELIDRVESWLSILDQSSYYELLSILEIADESAIQRAFHQFSENFHPDRYRGEPEELRHAVTKIYQRGAEAYGVLRDPKTRAAYDVALAQGQLRYNPGHATETAPTAQSVVSLAQTPGGRLHARQAERALAEGNVDEAARLLKKAQMAEVFNPALDQRVNELLTLARSGRFVSGLGAGDG